MEKVDLTMLIEKSQAESGLVFDSEGHVLDSHNVSNENNVSAMISVMATMSDELLQDTMGAKASKLISLASESGFIIINKINKDQSICLMTKDLSKANFMKLTLRKIVSK
ncbi:hypothetical protein [Tenacibaculum xiamenense]|uniref:hypothetical protein n=1 Tax=Tenacibaculum xiamenense TaxID=1261553 RepID=UPI00389482B2